MNLQLYRAMQLKLKCKPTRYYEVPALNVDEKFEATLWQKKVETYKDRLVH